MHFIQDFLHFFIDNFPPLRLIAWLFPVSILWSFIALLIAGFCKKELKWKTGYTRKIFHFLIFFSAYFYQVTFGLPGVFILGWSVTAILIFTCLKGDHHILYEALAREKDAPFRTKYIFYSYLATFFGGVFTNLLFGHFAIFGYAVTGIADAIAEPVGTKFGKHTYSVFSFDKKISYRSFEGSGAVFISTLVVCSLLLYNSVLLSVSMPALLLIALICTLVEALSPSGFDNALLQLTAGFLFSLFVT